MKEINQLICVVLCCTLAFPVSGFGAIKYGGALIPPEPPIGTCTGTMAFDLEWDIFRDFLYSDNDQVITAALEIITIGLMIGLLEDSRLCEYWLDTQKEIIDELMHDTRIRSSVKRGLRSAIGLAYLSAGRTDLFINHPYFITLISAMELLKIQVRYRVEAEFIPVAMELYGIDQYMAADLWRVGNDVGMGAYGSVQDLAMMDDITGLEILVAIAVTAAIAFARGCGTRLGERTGDGIADVISGKDKDTQGTGQGTDGQGTTTKTTTGGTTTGTTLPPPAPPPKNPKTKIVDHGNSITAETDVDFNVIAASLSLSEQMDESLYGYAEDFAAYVAALEEALAPYGATLEGF